MPRLNSRLEAEGAEHLVLGALLIEGIAAYKSYARMPGYDLIATNPERNTSARIQVKADGQPTSMEDFSSAISTAILLYSSH